MHKPKPKYGWHGQQDAPIPNKALTHWSGEEPKVTIHLRYEGVIRDFLDLATPTSRDIRRIAKSFRPDPARVPEEHFDCSLGL